MTQDEHENDAQGLEILITIPSGHAEALIEELEAESFDPDYLPSAGAEGGGQLASIVGWLTDKAVPMLSQAVKKFSAGSDLRIQIGETVLDAKRLRDPDVEGLIKTTLRAELDRARGASKHGRK